MSIYETTINNPKKQLEFYKQLSEQLQQENQQLKEQINEYKRLGFKHLQDKNNKLEDNWKKLKEYAKDNLYFYSGYQGEDLETDIAIQGILDKMQELERGVSDVED